MPRAKRISRTTYYAEWARAGFPKRIGKQKSFTVKPRKKYVFTKKRRAALKKAQKAAKKRRR